MQLREDKVSTISTFEGKEPSKETEKGKIKGIKEKSRESSIKKVKKRIITDILTEKSIGIRI